MVAWCVVYRVLSDINLQLAAVKVNVEFMFEFVFVVWNEIPSERFSLAA